MIQNLSPIVLFVYNRPEHTKKTIEGLLKNPEAKDSILYIFADGAKNTASKEAIENIRKLREYIRSITGFKNIIIEESDKNKGLASSTIYGITKVINQYGRVIMMEDDDVPVPYFLRYVNDCLEKFKDDNSIWCVSGYTNTNIMKPILGDDLFLVNRPSSWGFGTWKRCWDKVIWDIPTLKGIFKHKSIKSGYNRWGGADSTVIMQKLFDGKVSSWSIRYNFAAYLNNAYTIVPSFSLIENIGIDGSGTHCDGIIKPIILMDHEVNIPNVIKFDKKRNQQLYNSFSFWGKLPDRIYRFKKRLIKYGGLTETLKFYLKK